MSGRLVILHDHEGVHVYLQEMDSLLTDRLSMFVDSFVLLVLSCVPTIVDGHIRAA
jgi:hypothetical protein